MCRIDLCGQIGVKISSYGDTQFIKINPLNCPMGQFIRREDTVHEINTQEDFTTLCVVKLILYLLLWE